MALVLLDRAQETATANTTVSFTLLGASTGYQSLAGVGNTNTTYYGATDGTNWETGVGTYSTTGPTLARTTILASSNSGSAVTFSGAVTVWVDYPASQAVYENASNNVTGYAISGGTINNTPIGGTTATAGTFTNIASAQAPTNTVPALSLTGTPNNAAGAKTGVLGIGGNFTASDKNIMASFVQDINDYTQIVVQNPNAGTTASADFIVNNNNTTGAGTYGDFGINSSTFSGTGSLGAANATYLYSNGGDIAIGTNTANAIHFVANATATDAMSISSAGRVAINNASTNTTATALLHLGAGTATASTAPLKLTSGTNLTTAEAGAIEYDGTTFYNSIAASTRGVMPSEQIVVLNTPYTLTSQTAAQKLFNNTTNGAVTLPVGTYQFECLFSLSSMSATSGTFGFAMVAGTAVIGTQGWLSIAAKNAISSPVGNQSTYSTAANTTLTAANTTTTGYAFIRGIIKVSTAGTVIPSVSLSQASAAIVGNNSYFKISPITGASAANITVGNWS